MYVGYKEPFDGYSVSMDGQVLVHVKGQKIKADAVFSETEYSKKEGGKKILTWINDHAVEDIPSFLAHRFNAIWTIDTNTKVINGSPVSLSSLMECYVQQLSDTEYRFSYRKNGIFAFRNCPVGESEKYAWFKLVNMITSQPNYNENVKIALVTDHDLANHSKYNMREIPIYKDFYLHATFTLLYATTDAGRENLLNVFIKECDKDASKILQELEETGSANVEQFTINLDQIASVAE